MARWCFFLLMMCHSVLAGAEGATFTAGKQYKALSSDVYQDALLQALLAEHADENTTVILQFFSYGCHWCHYFEPTLQAWVDTLPESVVFLRIPVVFQPSWRALAKAYFTLESMDQLGQMHTGFFDAVQTGSRAMGSDDEIRTYLIKQGIEADAFDKVYQSFSMNRQMEEANALMRTFQVMAIPYFAMIAPDGTIYVTSSLVNPDGKQLIAVLDYLLTKTTSPGLE